MCFETFLYFSAVCSPHIEQGFPDPLLKCLILCLPVTDDILVIIFKVLDLSIPDHGMFWAICDLTYFGFLCSVEFTAHNMASFSPDIHLGLGDIAQDSNVSPFFMQIRIKVSKTDPFRKGCFVHIRCSNYPLHAIKSLIEYLAVRGNSPGPLASLPRWQVNSALHGCGEACQGISCVCHSKHCSQVFAPCPIHSLGMYTVSAFFPLNSCCDGGWWCCCSQGCLCYPLHSA